MAYPRYAQQAQTHQVRRQNNYVIFTFETSDVC